MSAFFGNDEEGESSEEGSDESSEAGPKAMGGLGARGLDFMVDDESSDDEGRVIKDAKTKAHDALTEIVTDIRTSCAKQDFKMALEQFAQLVKRENKHKKDIKKYGFPEHYIENLAKLKTKVNQEFLANKKDKKYVTKDQSGALAALKVKNTDKKMMYKKEVKEYMDANKEDLKENCGLDLDEDSDESSEEESEAESEEDEKADGDDEKASGDDGEDKPFRIGGSDGENEDADYFDSGSESDWPETGSDSEDDEDIGEVISDDLLDRMKRREFWVKADWHENLKTDEQRQQENIKARESRARAQKEKDQKAALRREGKRRQREKQAREAEEQSKKWKNIKIKLKKVLAERNRAGVDRMEIIEKLKDVAAKLSKDALYSNTLLTVKVILTNCLLDLSLNKLTGLPRKVWLETVDEIKEILRIMTTLPDGVSQKPLRLSQWVDLRITDDHDEVEEELDENGAEIKQDDEKEMTSPDSGHRDDIDVDDAKYSYVHGNLWAFLQRLSDQLALSLKNKDPKSFGDTLNTKEYTERQADENVLLEVLEQAQEYFRDFNDQTGEIDCALCRMSYLYSRYDNARDNVGQTRVAPPLGRFGPSPILKLDPERELVQLAKLVFSYNSNDEHTRRIRAILTQFPPPEVMNPTKDDDDSHIMASCKVADGWYSVPLVKVGLQGFKQVARQTEEGWYRTGEVGTIYLSSGGEKDEFRMHQEDVKDILLLEACEANDAFKAKIKRFHGKREGFFEGAMEAVRQLTKDGATTFKFTVELDGTRFLKANEPNVEQLLLEQNSSLYTLYSELCQALLKSKPKAAYGETRALQACLYLVYNQALHNNFYVARDLLQMSQLTASIYAYGTQTGKFSGSGAPKILRYDIKTTQVLFNRTIARLAISAFANGEWSSCMKILQELYGTRKIKELLAQGSGQRMDKLTDEELAKETKRRIPQHLHMELEVLESCHLISAMFFEIPMIVNYPNDDFRRHTVSRSFRKIWDKYIQKAHEQFMGPPETVRDHVFRAGMEMKEGNWKTCFNYLKQLDFWEKLSAKEQASRLVEREVKKQSLRCFLLMHGPQYCALSIKSLGDRFDMSARDLHMWISHLIESKDDNLKASWDQCSACLVVHSEPASRLQKALVSYTDKLHQLVEVNEELAKVGGYNAGQRRGYNKKFNNRNVLQRAAFTKNKNFGKNKNNKLQNFTQRRPNMPNNSGRFGR